MPDPGDVVSVYFAGATGSKRRPAVVVSSNLYHANRPDIILCLLTTQVAAATTPTDYILKDWGIAGLRHPSAFRAYLGTYNPAEVQHIGRLSEQDWQSIQVCLQRALAVPATP